MMDSTERDRGGLALMTIFVVGLIGVLMLNCRMGQDEAPRAGVVVEIVRRQTHILSPVGWIAVVEDDAGEYHEVHYESLSELYGCTAVGNRVHIVERRGLFGGGCGCSMLGKENER